GARRPNRRAGRAGVRGAAAGRAGQFAREPRLLRDAGHSAALRPGFHRGGRDRRRASRHRQSGVRRRLRHRLGRDRKLHQGDVPLELFTPRTPGEETLGTLFVYIRAAWEQSALIGVIPRIMAGIYPFLTPGPPTAQADEAAHNYFADRLLVSMSASFAGLAT